MLTLTLSTSLVAQLVKNLCVMQEIPVQPLVWDDPLEEGMTTHSSILAWRIPMDRGAWQATVRRVAKSTRLKQLSMHAHMLNYKTRPTVEYGDYSLPHFIVYLKIAKRVDLKISYHRQINLR